MSLEGPKCPDFSHGGPRGNLSKKGAKYQIAEITGGNLSRTNPSDQFGQRLEMVGETTLRIKDLKMEDSGEYNAHVRFEGNEYPKYSFNVIVYDEVPAPHIRLLQQQPLSISGWCNVTLQCLASGKSKMNIFLEIGDSLRVLEGSLDSNHITVNGTELILSWQVNASRFTATCSVSNPVDQKNTSYDLSNACQSPGSSPPRWRCGLFGILVIILVAVFFWIRQRKGNCNGSCTDPSSATEDVVVNRQNTAINHNGYTEAPLQTQPRSKCQF